MDLGRGLLGLDHPAGDRLAHPGVGDALGLTRRRQGWGGASDRDGDGRGLLLGGGTPEERLDVAADHATTGSASLDPSQLDLRGRGDLPGQRARLDPASRSRRAPCLDRQSGGSVPLLAVGRRGRRRVGLRGRFWLRPGFRRLALASHRRRDLLVILALLREDDHPLTQGHLITDVVIEQRDDTVVERRHLHGRLVGLDVGQDVALLDLVADLHHPLGDHPALHRRAELGHRHFDRHGISSLVSELLLDSNPRRVGTAHRRLAVADDSSSWAVAHPPTFGERPTAFSGTIRRGPPRPPGRRWGASTPPLPYYRGSARPWRPPDGSAHRARRRPPG